MYWLDRRASDFFNKGSRHLDADPKPRNPMISPWLQEEANDPLSQRRSIRDLLLRNQSEWQKEAHILPAMEQRLPYGHP